MAEVSLFLQKIQNEGLIMPAEWMPHQACVILYPHNPQTFRLQKARPEVLEVVRSIVTYGQERVYLLVKDEKQAKELSNESVVLEAAGSIQICVCDSDDTWSRDTAPTFVWSGCDLLGLDWDFNAYGGPEEGCYWPCERDKQISGVVCKILGHRSLKVPIILEGGSIHTDGEGTLIVTKECLLNKNRNPDLSQEEIEEILKQTLGAQVVIWLPQGLNADEDTNGHIDNFCCFTRPGQVVLAWTDDKDRDGGNFQRCRQALEVLSSTKDAKGRSIEVHRLQLPSPLFYSDEEAKSLQGLDNVVVREAGERMAASYVNFYIANKAVIVPQFGVNKDTDSKALEQLQELFPSRKVVGVPSREILIGGGNIHCITQQVPSAPLQQSS